MSIIARFKDIMSSNINALLDRAEDPEKMIDQQLRVLSSDLGKVKAETASVMAEEMRAKRAVDECREEIDKMTKYAVKALEAGSDSDARKFLEKKSELSGRLAALESAHQLAAQHALQMRQMHDKLEKDIGELEARRSMIKAKWSVAKTQERINKLSSSTASAGNAISAFERMEDKVNRALDEAAALAELNAKPKDEISDLAAKYDKAPGDSIDAELAALKASLERKDEA